MQIELCFAKDFFRDGLRICLSGGLPNYLLTLSIPLRYSFAFDSKIPPSPTHLTLPTNGQVSAHLIPSFPLPSTLIHVAYGHTEIADNMVVSSLIHRSKRPRTVDDNITYSDRLPRFQFDELLWGYAVLNEEVSEDRVGAVISGSRFIGV